MSTEIGKRILGKGCFIRDKVIVERCRSKRVLHVGCTDYPFFQKSVSEGYLLHAKVSEVASHIIGIDIASEDVATMLKNGYDVKVIDAQNMSKHRWEDVFEVVLLADVIEHIPNPGLVLSEAQKMLSPDGEIIITVPNTFGVIRYLKSFFQYEQVHHDHVAYYSSGVLETLAQHAGLKIKESSWYRFEARDRRLSVRMSAVLEKIITAFFPWFAEGCISVMTCSTAD